MKARIHLEYEDDYQDSIVIEGETLEDLQRQAAEIVEQRKPDYYWSESL